MEITLKDLLNEDEVRGIINAAVDDILQQVITLNVGTSVGTLPAASSKPTYKCEICGQTGFTAKASLGGHQYWKHDISKDKTVAEVRAIKAAKAAAKAAKEEATQSQTEQQLAVRAQAETG